MSHLQFQSKRFILRHAWLNLWDERMTTGRINQVAIFKQVSCTCHDLPNLPINITTKVLSQNKSLLSFLATQNLWDNRPTNKTPQMTSERHLRNHLNSSTLLSKPWTADTALAKYRSISHRSTLDKSFLYRHWHATRKNSSQKNYTSNWMFYCFA